MWNEWWCENCHTKWNNDDYDHKVCCSDPRHRGEDLCTKCMINCTICNSVLCSRDLYHCGDCGEKPYCEDCRDEQCDECKKQLCRRCAWMCGACSLSFCNKCRSWPEVGEPVCSECEEIQWCELCDGDYEDLVSCSKCNQLGCKSCIATCKDCRKQFCDDCMYVCDCSLENKKLEDMINRNCETASCRNCAQKRGLAICDEENSIVCKMCE